MTAGRRCSAPVFELWSGVQLLCSVESPGPAPDVACPGRGRVGAVGGAAEGGDARRVVGGVAGRRGGSTGPDCGTRAGGAGTDSADDEELQGGLSPRDRAGPQPGPPERYAAGTLRPRNACSTLMGAGVGGVRPASMTVQEMRGGPTCTRGVGEGLGTSHDVLGVYAREGRGVAVPEVRGKLA